MSFLGSALGGALSVVGSLVGARMQNSASERFQQTSINASRESMLNRHQWEVEDLKKAGLNPILSATNSAGGTINASAPSAAQLDFGKMLNSIANSALAKKEMDLAQFKADTDRIKSEADMLRAKQDEAKTQSAIDLASAQSVNQLEQSRLAVKSTEMLDKNYALQKAYTDAQVSELQQRIINSVMEVKAKVQYYHDSGQAALRQASAAEQAAASQAIIAEVARQNGISQRLLNDVLAGKADAETKEALQRTENAYTQNEFNKFQLEKERIHNPYASHDGLGRALMGAGEILRNGFSGFSGFVK